MAQIIHVTVKAHPKRPTAIISVAENGDMVVSIGTVPIHGQANKLLILFLAKYFQVAPRSVAILKGHTSRYKTIQILH